MVEVYLWKMISLSTAPTSKLYQFLIRGSSCFYSLHFRELVFPTWCKKGLASTILVHPWLFLSKELLPVPRKFCTGLVSTSLADMQLLLVDFLCKLLLDNFYANTNSDRLSFSYQIQATLTICFVL